MDVALDWLLEFPIYVSFGIDCCQNCFRNVGLDGNPGHVDNFAKSRWQFECHLLAYCCGPRFVGLVSLEIPQLHSCVDHVCVFHCRYNFCLPLSSWWKSRRARHIGYEDIGFPRLGPRIRPVLLGYCMVCLVSAKDPIDVQPTETNTQSETLQKMSFFETMPHEINRHIGSFLDPSSQVNFNRVLSHA